jgi:hypothetical protein
LHKRNDEWIRERWINFLTADDFRSGFWISWTAGSMHGREIEVWRLAGGGFEVWESRPHVCFVI